MNMARTRTMVREKIKRYIEHVILPQYHNLDAAHNVSHIQKVIQTSLNLALRNGANCEMAYVIAAFHDLGIKYGRANHAYNSGQILLNDKFINIMFTKRQMAVMVQAVEEHGSSHKMEPHTIYGKIIAQADRSLDIEMMVERAIGYGIANYPQYTNEEQCNRAIEYLQGKYGIDGRVKLWIDDDADLRKLNTVQNVVMDSEQMKKICERYLKAYHKRKL